MKVNSTRVSRIVNLI